jgi:hypothetical protein
MSTGDTHRPPAVKRTYIIEAILDPDTGEVVQDLARAERVVFQLLNSLWAVGGSVRIAADRVKVGELPAPDGGRKEPLGETVGLVIEYHVNTPLNRESLTAHLADQAYLAVEPEEEPAPAAAPVEPEPEADEPDDGDDEDDGIDGIPDAKD